MSEYDRQIEALRYMSLAHRIVTNEDLKAEVIRRRLPPNYGSAMLKALELGWFVEITKDVIARGRNDGLQRTYRCPGYDPKRAKVVAGAPPRQGVLL